jgi:hypothetical protein
MNRKHKKRRIEKSACPPADKAKRNTIFWIIGLILFSAISITIPLVSKRPLAELHGSGKHGPSSGYQVIALGIISLTAASYLFYDLKKKAPNQSLQTTTMAVTDAAAQPPRQP